MPSPTLSWLASTESGTSSEGDAIPLAKIPLTGGQNSNVEGLGLTDRAELVSNVALDENGVNFSRPGLIPFATPTTTATPAASPLIGLFPFRQWLVGVTKTRRVLRFASDGTYIDITGKSGLPGRLTPVGFLDDSGKLLIVAGGAPVAWNGEGKAEAYVPSAWMPSATHLAVVGGHLVANNVNTPQWFWSTVAEHTAFSQGGQFATAEGEANTVLRALMSFGGDAWLFGDKAVEVWYSTGAEQPVAFARYEHQIPVGLGAVRGLVLADNQIFFLDTRRRCIRLDRYDPKVISYDIERTLQALQFPEDCVTHWVRMRGRNWLLWTFARDRKAYCFDLVLEAWTEWGRIDAGGEPLPMPMLAYAYQPEWDRHICSAVDDNSLYELSFDARDDAGSAIVRERITGHITHGVSKPKNSRAIRIRMKSGETDKEEDEQQGSAPVFTIRWRDDGMAWGQPVELTLGATGVTESFQTLAPMGIYKSRQYWVRVSDPVDWALLSIEEDLEILDE